MDLWDTGFDPLEMLLRLQADVEQLQNYFNHNSEILRQQSHLLEHSTQHIIALTNQVQDLEKRIQELEAL